MKQINYNFSGTRGSIPPQLFCYVDTSDMAGETRRFSEYISAVAASVIDKINGVDPTEAFARISLDAPPLFGHDVRFEYVGAGTIGGVYKMTVGDAAFALKINYIPNVTADLVAMGEYKRARRLINRPYIGATFKSRHMKFSWVLSDYVANDDDNAFVAAKAKLFYAALTKGLRYSDMYPANTRDGKIVDIGGVTHLAPHLPRVEIDLVKKLLYFMRADDMVAVRRLADNALARHGDVINYMFVKMNLYQMEMPMRLQKFKKIIAEYNTRLRVMRDAAARQK